MHKCEEKIAYKVKEVYILVLIVYISALVFSHFTLAIDDILHPTGHAGDQILEEGTHLGALNPHLQDVLFPLLLLVLLWSCSFFLVQFPAGC